MAASLFLAQLLGLYFVIISLIVLVRQRTFSSLITEMARNRMTQLSIGMVELVAGLGIVLAFPKLSMDYVGIISLIGYMMVVESIFYLLIPSKWAKKIIITFKTSGWINAGAVIGLVAGLYLVAIGFGIIA